MLNCVGTRPKTFDDITPPVMTGYRQPYRRLPGLTFPHAVGYVSYNIAIAIKSTSSTLTCNLQHPGFCNVNTKKKM